MQNSRMRLKTMAEQALQDIRVLDFGHVLAGPTAAMILADLGAEVIHIEPFSGDDARQFGPFLNGQSAYFMSVNRNKQSLAVDLKKEAGKTVIRGLIACSDVIIENFRPDVMGSLGFSYDEAKSVNPGIIYASISGYGHDSLPDYQGRPSYDIIAQAFSGFMSITGTEEGETVRAGSSIGDIMAGHQTAISILAALHYREKTRVGQRIDQAMVDGMVYTLENAIARYSVTGETPLPLGTKHPSITPFQAFRTSDGEIVIPVGNNALWDKFCRVLEREEWIDDSRFITNELRTAHRDELAGLIQDVIGEKSTAAWQNLLGSSGIPSGPVNTIAQVVRDENLHHRNMIVEVDRPETGPLTIAGAPFSLSKTPGSVRTPAPLLGEHSRQILSDILDYTDDQIESLISEEVILTGDR